jgi:formylglycine-generating enzyme required for sulfatase activity
MDAEDGFKNSRWRQGLSVAEDHYRERVDRTFKFDNHPLERVSWYDAIAFCRWLNSQLNLSDDNGIRLPTEWEWQWAATGGNPKYEYPWGEEWDESKANTFKSGLWRTTAVGMYLTGSAQCGALDLSGNVWEWCLNEYENLENISVSGTEWRVVRGGSWNLLPNFARASFRASVDPYFRDYDFGFRIVVHPSFL